MSTELAVRGGSDLAISSEQTTWTPQQVAALKQLGVEDATAGDLAVFFHQTTRTGLDPFARQIYMVGRNTKNMKTNRWETKYTIQTGIDGFRLIGRRAADRRRETLEVSDTEWCGPDGVWRDVWLDRSTPPAAARVYVIRNGGRFPGLALFHEYAQTTKEGNLTKMWQEKGALMIAKCAEALAWRRAFPQDLSGLYTADEMSQQDNPPPPRVQPERPPSIADVIEPYEEQSDSPEVPLRSEEQSRKLFALMREVGLGGKESRDEALSLFSGWIGRDIESTKELTKPEASVVIDRLEAAKADAADPATGEVLDPDGGD